MVGKLYTTNLQGLFKINVSKKIQKLLITRAGPDIDGCLRDRELAPSSELFKDYLTQWKGQMDPELWWPLYEEKFRQQLNDPIVKEHLRDIYKHLLLGEDVAVICYCSDYHYCHRKIIGEFFKKYGIRVTELNPVDYQQLWLDL